MTETVLTILQDQDTTSSPSEALKNLERSQPCRPRALQWHNRRCPEGRRERRYLWAVRRHVRFLSWRRLNQLRIFLLVYLCSHHVLVLSDSCGASIDCRGVVSRRCGWSFGSAVHNSCRCCHNAPADHEQARAEGNDRHGYGCCQQ